MDWASNNPKKMQNVLLLRLLILQQWSESVTVTLNPIKLTNEMFPNTFIVTKSDEITIDYLCTIDTTLHSDSISAQ